MSLPQGPYNPTEYEKIILDLWLNNGYYKPEYNPKQDRLMSEEEMKADSREPWALICPPPNAYARPHIGNISGYAYQDAMARYARMQGKKVLVLPGKDHAGLEGEGVFIRDVLEKQGRNKFDMTREDFYAEMMEFFKKNMEIAMNDEKHIGLSADYDRNIFTLDPRVVDTVLNTFVEMYKAGMIYKGVRIVNWDPKARTAVADNQMVREERDGKIYYIQYKFADDSSKSITVATTRPETMFGDTAVAVNPSDERYKNLVGKEIIIPLTNIKIPIITNYKVLTDFGTGALKITPAHSQDDYQTMLEWNKENPNKAISARNIIDGNLMLVSNYVPEKYRNQKYTKVKEQIIEDLKNEGYLIKEEVVKQNINKAERTGAQIEPILSSQWYLKYDKADNNIKQAAIDMVKNGEVTIHPENMVDKFNHWMDNLRDWAISRSLWWGYRLPVWYHGEVKEEIDENGEVRELISLGEKDSSKIILVDAVKTIISCDEDYTLESYTLNKELADYLSTLKNKVIVVTSASGENLESVKSLLKDYNFEIFTLEKNPPKENPEYFKILSDKLNIKLNEVIYFDHVNENLESAKTAGIQNTKLYVQDNKAIIHWINDEISSWVPLEYDNPEHLKVQLESPGNDWHQDENVLDTWFSSGQWVYATLEAHNLKDTFFPTNVLVSAHDILENWDSRMMMFTYFHDKQIPFENLFLTGLVLGTDGQKMSKSKNNMIDMDKIVTEYGTDAVRMVYFYQNKAGGNYAITYDKLKNFKQFMNKIWNASKFVMGNLSEESEAIFNPTDAKHEFAKKLVDHITQVKAKVTRNVDAYEFGYATETLYEEFWKTYCDVLIEESKQYIYPVKNKETGEVISEPDENVKAEVVQAMVYVLKEYLKMLHPFIPFITQYIWNEVPKTAEDHKVLMYSKW